MESRNQEILKESSEYYYLVTPAILTGIGLNLSDPIVYRHMREL